MRATQDALHAGVAEDESLKESLGLFERLSAHGHELDGELRRLEAEPDRDHSRRAAARPAGAHRAHRSGGDSLRWAARDRARRFADDDLDALSAQIDVEAGALRHWTTAEPASARDRRGPMPRPPTARPIPADLAGGAPVAHGRGADAARHHPVRCGALLPLAEEAPPREHDLIRSRHTR